jgi:hypothetical protein
VEQPLLAVRVPPPPRAHQRLRRVWDGGRTRAELEGRLVHGLRRTRRAIRGGPACQTGESAHLGQGTDATYPIAPVTVPPHIPPLF